jgi:TPR repeat protein
VFGVSDSQFQVGTSYQYGLGGVSEDRVEATRWLSLASGQGHELAAVRLKETRNDMTVEQMAAVDTYVVQWEPKDCTAEEIASPSN